MVLTPIEVMDDTYEFKKLINSYFYDTTKQLMQGFELMASQLRGKLAAGGSSSFHHGETHKTIIFEDFDDFFKFILIIHKFNRSQYHSLIPL